MQEKSRRCSALPRSPPSSPSPLALSLSLSFVFFYLFVVRCLYRNPFSLLVRVIRGFKTAFHHQTLQEALKRAMTLPSRKTETLTLTTTTTVTKSAARSSRAWERSTEWLDANRPASFDGLSVDEEASRSAGIYRDCVRH